MSPTPMAECPLTDDDTFERGPVPPAHPCACQKSAGEPMDAIAVPPFEAGESSRAQAVNTGDLMCLPWLEVTKNADAFAKCMENAKKLGQIDTPMQLYTALTQFRPSIADKDQEVFWVVVFDTHMYIRGVAEIHRGTRDRVSIEPKDVLRIPLMVGAQAFAVAHCHPSGSAKPSEADRQLTKALEETAAGGKYGGVGVPLFDHLVVGANEFYSFDKKKIFKVKPQK